jgi:chitin synthase
VGTLNTAVITTTNAKASTSGANVAVSGYMKFLLYSEALLACIPSFLTRIVGFFFNEKMILIVRFCGSTGYIIVRMFAGE